MRFRDVRTVEQVLQHVLGCKARILASVDKTQFRSAEQLAAIRASSSPEIRHLGLAACQQGFGLLVAVGAVFVLTPTPIRERRVCAIRAPPGARCCR
jgi:hypothetical protein